MPYDIPVRLATEETETVLIDIADERVAQVETWGVQSLPDGTGLSTDASLASMFQGIANRAAIEGDLTWRRVLNEGVAEAYAETDPARLREELVQIAAVAVSWIEDLDRRGGDEAASERALAALRDALSDGSRVARDIATGRLPLRSPGATS